MSELNLFWRSISLWFWLLTRLAVMAAILFGSLFLMRTIFDPGVRPFDANKPIDFPHAKYVVLHAPLICTFWLSANAIFRTTGRKTATQFFGDDVMGFFVNAFIFGPILGALVVCVFGTPGYRAIAVGWVTGIAALPILLWILFEPGVFQSFAKADEQAREAERKRRRHSPPNYELRMRIIRRDYETKIHDINRMRIDEEERLYLQELADGEYRDRVRQIMSGDYQSGAGRGSSSIESLLQDSEDN
ncbi:hypothetical protein KOR42_34300 [Thalassoglobus neptunius]|uniref:Uncharacterized protein n=1 Tax=Thalassoglobus neptunius TaxID=1938619 RepID=A0A5C5WNZ3_9PLAN|nr:hypothetical protein [Thalassoglobus neptunius]TWT51743.1 hypothetical protein KOR42_34300 [Thalassoglobus neptunius]